MQRMIDGDLVTLSQAQEQDELTKRASAASAPAAVPATVTFAQFVIAAVAGGWMTEAEGDGWLQGTLPAVAQDVVAALPAGQRFAARARALRPSVIERADPLLAAMAAAQGATETDLDDLFRAAALV